MLADLHGGPGCRRTSTAPNIFSVLTRNIVGATVDPMTPSTAAKLAPPADDPVHVVRGAGQVAALLNPDRVRILAALGAPSSATGVAAQVGMTRQRANYHLRELERAGLVELVEERRRGNCTERILRASARSYLISPEALGAVGASSTAAQVRDRFSAAYLITTIAGALRDLAVLRSRADRAGKPLATLALQTDITFASAADRAAFAEELTTTLASLAAKYHRDQPGGRVFRFLLGGYPAITKREEESNAE
jgi:DNA-binding transcriptional ArsR family regulator